MLGVYLHLNLLMHIMQERFNMKQKYKVCVHYQIYDGYMGFDDWVDEYVDVEIESNKLGDELT